MLARVVHFEVESTRDFEQLGVRLDKWVFREKNQNHPGGESAGEARTLSVGGGGLAVTVTVSATPFTLSVIDHQTHHISPREGGFRALV